VTTYLLDVDGTLVDSTKPILLALNTALSDAGMAPITRAELGRYVGPPLRTALDALFAERGEDGSRIPSLMEAYRRSYQPLSVELAITYPGIPDLLDALHRDARLAVVTTKPAVYAVPILDALGFASMMEVVEGPDVDRVETKTVTMARALERLGHRRDIDLLTMVGDRHHDVEAGTHHGATTIGVTWGFGSRRELSTAGADHIVDRPDEILGIAQRARSL
jgi:phosphoglycolate phosphatase